MRRIALLPLFTSFALSGIAQTKAPITVQNQLFLGSRHPPMAG
jgi:hypothetical protein